MMNNIIFAEICNGQSKIVNIFPYKQNRSVVNVCHNWKGGGLKSYTVLFVSVNVDNFGQPLSLWEISKYCRDFSF